MLKVNKKDTRTTSVDVVLLLLTWDILISCSIVFDVDFKQVNASCESYCWASNYQRGYFFPTNCALRVVNVRRSILFNIVKNWNQTKFKSCKAGVSAFGWFLVILPGAGWFCAISNHFMIYTIYMIYFF